MLPKGVAPSNVDPLVYNQKTDAYHRSGTSDQFTQHDALGAFRCDVGVYSKPVVRSLLFLKTLIILKTSFICIIGTILPSLFNFHLAVLY